ACSTPQRPEPAPAPTQARPALMPVSKAGDAPTIQSGQPMSLEELFPLPELTCLPSAKDRQSVRARHIVMEPVNWRAGQQPTLDDWHLASRKATQVLAALAGGPDFAQLEIGNSSAASARGLPGGDLGYFGRGVMVPQIERVAFCLPVNQLSPVVRSDFGFHIIQVTGSR
ncbi:MAG: peptidylprolyl isomerase, partial [Burkholderiaceae bacterium]